MASPADVGELTTVRPDLLMLEQHLVTEESEDIDYVSMEKASRPASYLLYHAVKDLQSLHTIETILSFLKDTLCGGGGCGSSIAKSDFIDHDHEDGTDKGSSKWFPKQFTNDYLAKYMIGRHAMKVKVFHQDYNESREVLMKTVKDGRASMTKDPPNHVPARHLTHIDNQIDEVEQRRYGRVL
ncbi:LRR receptor-like serine/threonine-protein kinase RPK2 [Hordeum vulgare]|nr:LRR receptor-like serine/threonine-protein kinase RPK2 [Hordeum vulgare]